MFLGSCNFYFEEDINGEFTNFLSDSGDFTVGDGAFAVADFGSRAEEEEEIGLRFSFSS